MEIILHFKKSRSIQFKTVYNLAKEFEKFTINDQYQITTDFTEIFIKWETFNSLFGIICSWSSFILTIGKSRIANDMVRKFFYSIQDIKNSYRSYKEFDNKDLYCNRQNWGCVFLKN